MLLFPAACCRCRTCHCTGQTRACSRCVVVYLWSCFNEAFCKIVPSDIVVAYFFIYLYVFSFFQACFSSTRVNPGWICIKQTKTRARLIRTCDTCAHTYSYKLYVYIMIQQHCAVLLHVVGTHELFSIILLCACARTLMHVPCTYNTILYILCNDKKQQQQ